MATATITKRQDYPKTVRLDFTVDGKHGSAVCWKSDPWVGKLTEGATVDLGFEKKPKKDKPDETEVWVASVDGESSKPKQGGAGRTFQPKTREEIHAASIAGILKSCRELSPAPKPGEEIKDARAWCDLYIEMVGKVAG